MGVKFKLLQKNEKKKEKSFKKYSVRHENNPYLDRIDVVGTECPLD